MIAGTDTGVGKTFVGCGLAVALRHRGLKVAPFKPAESGCEFGSQPHALVPSDAQKLRYASQCEAPLETICPYRFRAPVAPWVAAESTAEPIRVDRLQQCYQELAFSHNWVLVETAGGILVPLTEHFHYADLARLLHLPVLLVAASRLGVINQVRLTLEYLGNSGIPIIGCVLNHPLSDQTPAVASNSKTLRRLVRHPLYLVEHAADGQQPQEQAGIQQLADALVRMLPLS